MMGCGIIITWMALRMDVRGGDVQGIGAIANMDKMNQRSDWVVIGMGLFVCGIVVIGMSAIQRTIIGLRGQT